jgi:hypothetical protein
LSEELKSYLRLLQEKAFIEVQCKEFLTQNGNKNHTVTRLLMDGLAYQIGPNGKIKREMCSLLAKMIEEDVIADPYLFMFFLIKEE